MKALRLAAIALLLAGPALAQTSISDEIAANGLSTTEARLSSLTAPSDEERFALAGVRFLTAIERLLQAESSNGLWNDLFFVPIPQLMMGGTSGPVKPEALANQLRDLSESMTRARSPLQEIPANSAFGLTVNLGDLWFDINSDGTRSPGEGVMEFGRFTAGDATEDAAAPVVRFDVADAAWLAAYTHVLAGTADVVLAYDPTQAIRTVTESQTAFDDLSPMDAETAAFLPFRQIDAISILLRMLDQQPDPARMAQARENFLAMVDENRTFWTRVGTETDNEAEWVPNDAQQSATGIELPQGTGAAWLAVLDEVEAILQGKLLIPFWRTGNGAGLNVARLFTEPRPIDVAGWIQGADALPYLEKGPLASAEAVSRFNDLVGGNGLMLSFFLN